MPKKKIILSIALLSLPIGFTTYQYVYQTYFFPSTITQTEIDTTAQVTKTTTLSDVTKKQSNNSPASRSITVFNKIDKKMLTYHKGFFSLTPNFNLFVNDKPIKPGQQLEISIAEDTINVAYAYDFMGHKKGKKSISFEIPTNKDTLNITFSWQKEPRIIIDGAKPLEVKEIY